MKFILLLAFLLLFFYQAYGSTPFTSLILEDEQANSTLSQYNQDALDAIVNTFKALPPGEVDRLGVDLGVNYKAGSPDSRLLINAWITRQAELRSAMEGMTKPVEVMANITKTLLDSKSDYSTLTTSLIDLEGLLTDVDNARDFHTIGGWPVLASFLSNHRPIYHRELAAWAVGTAVKNTYDYQLWTIEKLEIKDSKLIEDGIKFYIGKSTCIDLLVESLDFYSKSLLSEDGTLNQEVVTLGQRVLYAIASSSRSNVEVQEMLSNNVLFINSLQNIAEHSQSVKVYRKLWAFVSDMLVDVQEFRDHITTLPKDLSVEEGDFTLLGIQFCSQSWLSLSLKASTLIKLFQQDNDKVYAIEAIHSTLNNQRNICRNLDLEDELALEKRLTSFQLESLQSSKLTIEADNIEVDTCKQ